MNQPPPFSVSLWGRSLYRGSDREKAHAIAQKAARASEFMGECVIVLGEGQLVTYRRGPQGLEKRVF